MTSHLFYADRFVTIADPYIFDDFVQKHHVSVVDESSIPELLGVYQKISSSNRLLVGLLQEIIRVNDRPTVKVVDIGVFMGTFLIGIGLASRAHGLPVTINAYEANPLLIASILKNMMLYGVDANLHWAAVGKQSGSQEFLVNDGAAIGGSLGGVKERRHGNFFSCNVDVIPLAQALADADEIELVKIDIEGYEVPAFASIFDSMHKLKNVFIVEFAPEQLEQELSKGLRYGDFLLANFEIFNLGNWGWFKGAVPVRDREGLAACALGNGGKNTDALLIPKGSGIDVSRLVP